MAEIHSLPATSATPKPTEAPKPCNILQHTAQYSKKISDDGPHVFHGVGEICGTCAERFENLKNPFKHMIHHADGSATMLEGYEPEIPASEAKKGCAVQFEELVKLIDGLVVDFDAARVDNNQKEENLKQLECGCADHEPCAECIACKREEVASRLAFYKAGLAITEARLKLVEVDVCGDYYRYTHKCDIVEWSARVNIATYELTQLSTSQ